MDSHAADAAGQAGGREADLAVVEIGARVEAAIRRRPDAPQGELDVVLTARMMFVSYDLIARRWDAGSAREPWERVAERLLADLADVTIALPR